MKYFFVFTLFCSFLGNAQSYLDFHFKSNGITGAVVIYNDNTNEWIFNNESEPFTNTPIAAHFHLWQTLVGLENGVFSTKENDEKSLTLTPENGITLSFCKIKKYGAGCPHTISLLSTF